MKEGTHAARPSSSEDDRPAPRYGLTQQEVADLFGITRSRVMQIEHAALAKLRRHPLILELAVEYGVPTS